jgi:hypothetical protein
MKNIAWALAAALNLALAACGGGGGSSGDVGGDASEEVRDADSRAEDAAPDSEPDSGPVCSGNLVLEFFGIEDGMGLETGTTLLVQARIYDSVLALPVGGLEVTFELTGSGDALLLSALAITSDQGVAAVEMSTGSVQGAEYDLAISSPCTGKVGIALHTVAPGQGSVIVHLQVAPNLTALFPVLQLEVYSSFVLPLCAAVDFNAPAGAPVKLPAGALDVELPGIKANAAHVVFGVARNSDGIVVGGGCAEGVVVLPDKTVEVDVLVEPLSLKPATAYSVELSADLVSAAGTNWVDAGKALADVVAGAPVAVGTRVVEDLEVWFPEGFPAECADADEQIQGLVDAGFGGVDTSVVDWIAAEADPMMKGLLQDVVLSGKLMVGSGELPQAYELLFTCEKLAYSGKARCRTAGCGVGTEVMADQFSLGDVKLALGQHVLTMVTDGFDSLVFPQVELTFEPGRLVLSAFTHVVLPAAGQSMALDDLFGGMYDCDKVFSGMTPQLIACLNKSPTQLAESCDSAVAEMKMDFYSKLGLLTGQQVTVASGTGQSFDDDADLEADRLEGQLSGSWTSDGTQAGEVAVGLSATKK